MASYTRRTVGAAAPPGLTDQLRLYHADMNPHGHRVLLILEAKNVKYDIYWIDVLRYPQWLRVKHPNFRLPALELPTERGDKLLFQSLIICDYLDEKYPQNPLHSRDPYRKAQDKLLLEEFEEVINGMVTCFETNLASGGEQIVQTLDIFEEELVERGTKYFSGNKPGMLDYMIWPWIERLFLFRFINERRFEERKSRFPNFVNWADQMLLGEVVKTLAKSPKQYFDYYRSA